MKSRAIILAVAVIAIISCCVVSIQFEEVELDDVDPKLRAELQKLTPQFVRFSKILKEKLDNNPDLFSKNMDVAKRELKKAKTIGCFGACLTARWTDPWIKSLEIYTSMERTQDRCDTESYEILLKNFLATEKAGIFDNLINVREAINFYRCNHFKLCREVYRQEFAERLKRVSEDTLLKIQNAFTSINTLSFKSHEYLHETIDLFDMQDPKFSQATRARQTLARTVFLQVKGSSNQKVESLIKPIEFEVSKKMFDEYLFEPCEIYRKELGSIPIEARFDATCTADRKAQYEFIRGDDDFHRGLINFRLCGSLLEEREKLYEPLAKALNEYLA